MMATTRYRVERASARGLIGAESVLCFCDIYSKRRVGERHAHDRCRSCNANGPGTAPETDRTDGARPTCGLCVPLPGAGGLAGDARPLDTNHLHSVTHHSPAWGPAHTPTISLFIISVPASASGRPFRGTTCVHAYSRASTSQHRTHATGTADPWADPAGGRRADGQSDCPRVRACRLDRKIDECMQYADYRLDYMFSYGTFLQLYLSTCI